MIILITYLDKKQNKVLVSHGINADTMKTVILPQESPYEMGAKFNNNIGEWVLED